MGIGWTPSLPNKRRENVGKGGDSKISSIIEWREMSHSAASIVLVIRPHLCPWLTFYCAVVCFEAPSYHPLIWLKKYLDFTSGGFNYIWNRLAAKWSWSICRKNVTVLYYNKVIWALGVVLQIKIQELQSDHVTLRNYHGPLTACVICVISGILRRQNPTRSCIFPEYVTLWNERWLIYEKNLW